MFPNYDIYLILIPIMTMYLRLCSSRLHKGYDVEIIKKYNQAKKNSIKLT